MTLLIEGPPPGTDKLDVYYDRVYGTFAVEARRRRMSARPAAGSPSAGRGGPPGRVTRGTSRFSGGAAASPRAACFGAPRGWSTDAHMRRRWLDPGGAIEKRLPKRRLEPDVVAVRVPAVAARLSHELGRLPSRDRCSPARGRRGRLSGWRARTSLPPRSQSGSDRGRALSEGRSTVRPQRPAAPRTRTRSRRRARRHPPPPVDLIDVTQALPRLRPPHRGHVTRKVPFFDELRPSRERAERPFRR